jgi:ATP-dependent helicase/nuclease subunit B
MSRPSIFTIAPGENFLAALARQLLAETHSDPLSLSSFLILLPTRRACRALGEEFLRQSGGQPLILPAMRPIGDPDEDDLMFIGPDSLALPPAIPDLRRRLLLARIIQSLGTGRGGTLPPSHEQAVVLAEELCRWLDQVQTEGLSFDGLAELVPAELARHWQRTLEFLTILTGNWPKLLAAEDAIDPAARRTLLIAAQAVAWATHPPDFPVIAAGSTGSVPATRALLKTVARMPTGRLVLPGLDREIDESSRAALDETHPQFNMIRLLREMDIAADAVSLWPGTHAPSTRARLIAEAMRPADATDAWRDPDGLKQADIETALEGFTRIDCANPREEAGVIALMMREALEQDGRSAALVTPDRALARRVAAELTRFDIVIDDSAGRPLPVTPPGAYLLLTARMVADAFAPHALLAALQHPLAQGGMAPGHFRALVRDLNKEVLRGPRPEAGLMGLRRAAEPFPKLTPLVARLTEIAHPFADLMAAPDAPLGDLVRAHAGFAEALAADDINHGAANLWRGEAGEAAADFISDLADAADALTPLPGSAYPGLLRALMEGKTVRPAWGGHPRLAIWGPLEARLLHADLVVLGGLNEGVWPPAIAADPWMSRPMRQDFHLPAPEIRTGLSAHDFAQLVCAPNVALTRSTKADGSPTLVSRWLMRLDAVLEARGIKTPWGRTAHIGWFQNLDRPDTIQRPAPPAPKPPVAARPRSLAVTSIEMWRRDPYAIYAKYILKLNRLDDIDATPEASDYGTIIHRTLDAFVTRYPNGPLPDRALAELLALGRERFGAALARPGIRAFWWPRFERAAVKFVALEAPRRAALLRCWTEIKGALTFDAPVAPFTVRATADRIDEMRGGGLVLIDYKTGQTPSHNEIAWGYAPQLPLEAAIAAGGGFPGVPAASPHALKFWRFRSGDPALKEIDAIPKGHDPASLADTALDGLKTLVAAFDDPARAYLARPHSAHAPRYSDYLHLARVREWASGESGGGDAGDGE